MSESLKKQAKTTLENEKKIVKAVCHNYLKQPLFEESLQAVVIYHLDNFAKNYFHDVVLPLAEQIADLKELKLKLQATQYVDLKGAFKRRIVKNYIIPSKSHSYGEDHPELKDESPEGLYPACVVSETLLNKIVTIVPDEDFVEHFHAMKTKLKGRLQAIQKHFDKQPKWQRINSKKWQVWVEELAVLLKEGEAKK